MVEIVRDHDLRLAVLRLECQLFDSIQGIEVDDRAAGFKYCKIIDDECRGVRKEEADFGSALYSNTLQAGRHPVRPLPRAPHRSWCAPEN